MILKLSERVEACISKKLLVDDKRVFYVKELELCEKLLAEKVFLLTSEQKEDILNLKRECKRWLNANQKV